jgi:hypothetical protein
MTVPANPVVIGRVKRPEDISEIPFIVLWEIKNEGHTQMNFALRANESRILKGNPERLVEALTQKLQQRKPVTLLISAKQDINLLFSQIHSVLLDSNLTILSLEE